MQVRDEHVYLEGSQGDAEAGAQAASLSSSWFTFLSLPSQSTQWVVPRERGRALGAPWTEPEMSREQKGEVRLQLPLGHQVSVIMAPPLIKTS